MGKVGDTSDLKGTADLKQTEIFYIKIKHLNVL